MVWKILPLAESSLEDHQVQHTHLRQAIVSNLPESKRIAEQLAVAILAGFLFSWLDIPVGWLLGPMLIGIAYAVIQDRAQPLPAAFLVIGKALMGIATAVRFSPETLSTAKTYAVPLLLCILVTGSLSLLNGYLLGRWAGIDRTTGFLAFIPGVASSIVAMSEEMGADAIAVAVFQYLRLLLVVLLVPTTVSLLIPANLVTQVTTNLPIASHPSLPISLNLLVLFLCCGAGVAIGQRLRLPSSGFLGTFLVGLATFWLLPQLQVPPWLFSAGMLLVGLSIGIKFDWQAARKLWKAVLIELVLVIVLIASCLGVGYEFHVMTHVDLITAVLGFTPGGTEAMIATVVQLGGDAGLVMAMQMSRMLVILLISPWLAALMAKEKPSNCQSEGK
ncbi:AbrB family transcriptional regulator [Lyngbya aestuarii]|uniref:AbrB family transcriptional regulator n=1 Tax=Lyngbya aestuarii TaxID=118322 RepID=UPI00403E0C78